MVVKRYRKGKTTWYTQPFDRYPSWKDRDFVEQMDRQHQKLTRLCLKRTDFEEDCEKHLGQLPPYIQKHFYAHIKEYEIRRNAIKHIIETLTLQGYTIEDCKHLHVVKYKVVDVDIEEEKNGCTDDTIVHDIRPLTPIVYNAGTRQDTTSTDKNECKDDTIVHDIRPVTPPTEETECKEDTVKPTDENGCKEDNGNPMDESESNDDNSEVADKSDTTSTNTKNSSSNLDVLRMLSSHLF